MNKLQSFLSQQLDLMQAVEPDDQLKIDGGCKPTWGPGGTFQGDIPHGPILKEPIESQRPVGPMMPTQIA
jgi:hypothetical protein